MRVMLMDPSYMRIGIETLDCLVMVKMVALSCFRYLRVHLFSVLFSVLIFPDKTIEVEREVLFVYCGCTFC